MTGQISDQVRLNDESYCLIGHTGNDLFHPLSVGIWPEQISTACYRGFYCKYEIAQDTLYLQELTVRDAINAYPEINGVSAKTETEMVSRLENGKMTQEAVVNDYERLYSDLRMLIPYTGKLRLARDMVPELYIHMGFQKASAFRTVLDVTLFQSKVASINDRSDDMEKIRGQFKRNYESGDFMKTIDDAFKLDINLE